MRTLSVISAPSKHFQGTARISLQLPLWFLKMTINQRFSGAGRKNIATSCDCCFPCELIEALQMSINSQSSPPTVTSTPNTSASSPDNESPTNIPLLRFLVRSTYYRRSWLRCWHRLGTLCSDQARALLITTNMSSFKWGKILKLKKERKWSTSRIS